MRLRAWIKKNNLSVKEFAYKLEISSTHLVGCLGGKAKAGKHLKHRIFVVTNHEVHEDEIPDANCNDCCPICGKKWTNKKEITSSDIAN